MQVLDVGKYSNPSFGPFSQVFGSVPGVFFSFLSILDVAYLNCQPFLPIFNHLHLPTKAVFLFLSICFQ